MEGSIGNKVRWMPLMTCLGVPSQAFTTFKRNGLDHTLHFATKLPRKLAEYSCDLTRR